MVPQDVYEANFCLQFGLCPFSLEVSIIFKNSTIGLMVILSFVGIRIFSKPGLELRGGSHPGLSSQSIGGNSFLVCLVLPFLVCLHRLAGMG